MRRPIPVATAVIALLLVLGAPFLGLRLTQPDDRVLPPGAEGRAGRRRDPRRVRVRGGRGPVGGDRGRAAGRCRRPTPRPTPPTWPSCPACPESTPPPARTAGEGVADQLGCEPGQLVLGPDTSDRYAGFTPSEGSYLSVVPAVEPLSPEGEDLVEAVRDLRRPLPCSSPACRPGWST